MRNPYQIMQSIIFLLTEDHGYSDDELHIIIKELRKDIRCSGCSNCNCKNMYPKENKNHLYEAGHYGNT